MNTAAQLPRTNRSPRETTQDLPYGSLMKQLIRAKHFTNRRSFEEYAGNNSRRNLGLVITYKTVHDDKAIPTRTMEIISPRGEKELEKYYGADFKQRQVIVEQPEKYFRKKTAESYREMMRSAAPEF